MPLLPDAQRWARASTEAADPEGTGPDAGCRTVEELEEALHARPALRWARLADLLVAKSVITAEQRDVARARQLEQPSRPLASILAESGAASAGLMRNVLLEHLRVPKVNVAHFPFDANALRSIGAALARKHLVLPLLRTGQRLVVAMEDPLSWEALRELEAWSGLHVEPCRAERGPLRRAVEQMYGDGSAGDAIGQLVAQLDEEEDANERSPHAEDAVSESDNTLVRLVNKMIADAFAQRASDIHVESRRGHRPSRVRFRIDGVLVPYIEVPPNFRAALLSRIKIMAALDISERRRPQDGKIRFEQAGGPALELRVLTMPTASGMEDAVLRILTTPRARSLEQLGLAPANLAALRALAAHSFGLLLVCGPTGSGKTTTLHALVATINTVDRKIWTVEDPIEITQEGLCQVQVNPKIGLTFPSVLRSFLRGDPDVVMVGETRDEETARTLVSASLTGHLVFSTMHTNNAVESVVRLLDFGLDPFNFSDALLGVLGQRLVRKLCHCKTAHAASDEELLSLAGEYCLGTDLKPAAIVARWRARYGDAEGVVNLGSPAGCPDCGQTGYRGRMGVYELFVATSEVKAAIQRHANTGELASLAAAGGMLTLAQDAIEKILQGSLDLKEVLASCR